MNYALIENGVVTNIIWLADSNANDFPNAVKLNDRPVVIGDNYYEEKFYRNGVEVLTVTEALDAEIGIYQSALHTLGVQTYEEVLNDAE